MDLIVFAESGLKSTYKSFFEELEEQYGTVQTLQAIESFPEFPKVIFYQNNNSPLKASKDILYFEIKGQNLSFKLETQKKKLNHFQITPSSSTKNLHLIFENFFKNYIQECEEKLKADSQILLKGFKRSLKEFKTTLKLSEDREEVEAYIWDSFSLKDPSLELTKKVSRYFEFLKITTYFDHLKQNSSGDFLWLASHEYKQWGLSFKIKESELEARYILLELSQLIVFIFDLLFKTTEKEIDKKAEISDSNIKPFAVVSKQNELILYNEKFKELNLSGNSLKEVESLGKIDRNNKSWVVKNEKFELGSKEFIIYLFEEISGFLEKANQPSSQELGIITSSIAHELNNPLAGILAAVEVISLDTEDENILAEIQEMKKTVIRCKKLVETFLGFSKAKTNPATLNKLDINESFEQAIDLIRFRLIESNLKLQHIKVVEGEFGPEFNFSIMTMLFYIILGEVVTYFGHQKLVQNNSHSQLEIKMTIFNRKIELEFKNMKLPLDNLEKSKLFIHLTENLACKVTYKQSGLVLSL